MRITALPLTAATALSIACVAPPEPPAVCGYIPQQNVFAGEEGMVSPCFEDKIGSVLTFSVVSDDSSVATVQYVGDKVVFEGVSPGEAAVIVMATNEQGLTAQTAFLVVVPNRPPTYVWEVEAIRVLPNRSAGDWDPALLFREPDGEDMTFGAVSSDSIIAKVVLSPHGVVIIGMSGGEAQVILSATDPHGSVAIGTIQVFVPARTTMVDDRFDGEESLNDWTEQDATLSVQDGSLHIEPKTPGDFGVASQETDRVTNYDIDLVFKPVAGGRTGVTWRTGDPNIEALRLVAGELTIGEDSANWAFARLSSGEWNTLAHGQSDHIELGEYSHFSISMPFKGHVKIVVDGYLLLAKRVSDVPVLGGISLVAADGTGQFDFVIVNGYPLENPGSNARKITLPLDMRTRR